VSEQVEIKPGQIRLIVAAIASGPAAGLIGAFVFVYTSMPDPETIAHYAFLFGPIMGAIYGWPAMAVVGIPAHHWLVKQGRTQLWWYLAASILAGFFTLIVAAVMNVASAGKLMDPASLIQQSPLHFGTALLAAAIFWLIRRPDQIQRLDGAAEPKEPATHG
jgi:hypothetical protein